MKKDYFYDVVLNGSDKFEEYVKLLDETFKYYNEIENFAKSVEEQYNHNNEYKYEIYKFLIKIKDCLGYIHHNFDLYNKTIYNKIRNIQMALFEYTKIGNIIIKDILNNKFNSLFNNGIVVPYHREEYYKQNKKTKDYFIAPNLINDYEYYNDTLNEKFFIINSYLYCSYYSKTKINLTDNIKELFYFNNADSSNYFDEFVEYFNVIYIDIFIRENDDLDSLAIQFENREDMFILLNPIDDSYDDIIKQNENSKNVFEKFLLNQNKIKKHLTLSF